MNYLTHAHRLLAVAEPPDPYEIAGTSLPDWLGVVDRKIRVRSAPSSLLLENADARWRALARGVMRHHFDDAWFHETDVFRRSTLEFALVLRERWKDETGMRSGFVGHVLVELLLDATLSERHARLLDSYYGAMRQIDGQVVRAMVEQVSGKRDERIGLIVPRMIAEGFLRDYADDQKLLFRLNQVMRRVRLPELPEGLGSWLPEARRTIRERADELIAAPREFRLPGDDRSDKARDDR
ncbi:MAG TPA: hypothetical protein PLI18_20160 [Pirellulaceae bacterium]|nr:hypothetical protein [Pirellulaceae bacterium]